MALVGLHPVAYLRTQSTARCSAASVESDHAKFVKEIAGLQPPANLNSLLNVLQEKGEKIVSPENRRGMIPLVIPLSEEPSSGSVTALLRWPTAPEGMAMPLVQVQKYGVSLMAKSADDFLQRAFAEEDAGSDGHDDRCYSVSEAAAKLLYNRGDFKESKLKNMDVYLLKKVGLFPDVFERLALNHIEKGDTVSGLVTGEYYASKKHFPGFGRPFVFNAELLVKVGRKTEAKDSANIALKSPWWTLGCSFEEVADLAGCGDAKVEYMREKVTEDGKQEELQKGKASAQVALDQAAFLLDLASVDQNWDDIREQLALFYKEAGLEAFSKFILS